MYNEILHKYYTIEHYSAIRRMKYCHLWQHEWTYRILYLGKSEKGKYYVRYMKSKKEYK